VTGVQTCALPIFSEAYFSIAVDMLMHFNFRFIVLIIIEFEPYSFSVFI